MSQRIVWMILLASVAAAALLAEASGLTIAAHGFVGAGATIVAGLGAGWLCRREPDGALRRAASAFEAVSAIALLAVTASVASYALVRTTRGYVDPWLARADDALGFDWLALYRLTYAHPLLQALSENAYGTLSLSPLLLAAGLTIAGREARLRRFVVAFAATLWTTVALFPLFPARSAWLYHLGGEGPHRPMARFVHATVIERLRRPGSVTVELDRLVGLVTFPSFHAACAVLFIWAAWPVRRLRLLMLAINLAMLAATPVQGTHYLIDLVGGIACALFMIALVQAPARRNAPDFAAEAARA